MFGWIKRLGRKPTPQTAAYWVIGAQELETVLRRRDYRADVLREQIATAKRQKKKHSHLAAELARLEQADRSPTHMIQEPGL